MSAEWGAQWAAEMQQNQFQLSWFWKHLTWSAEPLLVHDAWVHFAMYNIGNYQWNQPIKMQSTVYSYKLKPQCLEGWREQVSQAEQSMDQVELNHGTREDLH